MKKLIILLTLVLSFSCLNARSIKFEVITHLKDDIQKILITDSKSKDRKSYIFKTHSFKVIVSDNATEIKKLEYKMMTIFSQLYLLTKDSSFSVFRTIDYFEDNGIFNDWQITNVHSTNSNDASIQVIFMHKKDK